MSLSKAEIECVLANSKYLLDEVAVEAMFDQLAIHITEVCQHKTAVFLCVMTGAIVAVGRWLPKLKFPLEVDYIHATHYQGDVVGHDLVWKQLPSTSLEGRAVILVDDVFDEGNTLHKLKAYCEEQKVAHCYTVVLLEKELKKAKPIQTDFVGFKTGDEHLFGLGMDYKNYLRNVSGLYACPSNIEELLCQQ